MALLETRNATKRFGGLTAVNDLTFDLDEGAIVSVIGPNGAGKTTLFRMLVEQEAPDAYRALPSVHSAESTHGGLGVELAVAGEPQLVGDARELRREGPSYSIDSLAELRAELGESRGLCLVMGCDAVLNITTGVGHLIMMCLIVVKPSMTGIFRSVSSRSAGFSFTASSASLPWTKLNSPSSTPRWRPSPPRPFCAKLGRAVCAASSKKRCWTGESTSPFIR